MKYYKENNIHILEIPVSKFKIKMVDDYKKNIKKENYTNAGYFGKFNEGKDKFTLPVAHLVCDMDTNNKWVNYYCKERGKLINNKFYFDSGKFNGNSNFYNKAISSLIINNGIATIENIINFPSICDYVISGVPIMRYGNDVKYNNYVTKQGWDSSTLYGTWHIFVGIKKQKDDKIYIIGMETKTKNMVLSAEAFNKFKNLGFEDVIKVDGGGSFYMKYNGKVLKSTLENRRINTIFEFDDDIEIKDNNPYKEPTRTLVRGKTGEDVKWLQYQLNKIMDSGLSIDGSFGPGCYKTVCDFQRKYIPPVDGSVGPATRKKLMEF